MLSKEIKRCSYKVGGQQVTINDFAQTDDWLLQHV
jgi:hypothetical protein